LATTAASSFFVLWCGLAVAGMTAASAGAQTVGVEVRGGWAASTPLVEDLVATPALRSQLGSRFEGSVEAVPGGGPLIGMAVRRQLRPRVVLELSGAWTFSELRARDASGTRDVQDLGVAHATVGVRYGFGAVELGGGFGAIKYVSEERGLFAEGSDIQPVLEAGAGVALPLADGRVGIRATGQFHRFGLNILRSPGSEDGGVLRGAVMASIRVRGGRP
jgi:hypothetical protein